jgi:sulfite exporter TauE/SafE/plastocyanin domain-containing protein
VVGAIGSVITVSGRFQGVVLLLAGIFMLIMGFNMLGLFPSLRRFMPSMPKIFTHKIEEQKTGKGPLVVGFLNGFMPCGPLQAMQLYALSTGSPVRGGISMFLFCIGTIPLMFALGAAGGILSGAKGKAFSRRVMQIGAILICAMGLTMFVNGWNLTGFNNPLAQPAYAMRSDSGSFTPVIQNGVQIINSTLLPNRYPAIVVQQGIPVRWTINAPQGSINGCNNRFIVREYGIEHTFKYGENIIEFMPAKTGRFPYSCWMGMIRSSITVFAQGENFADIPEPTPTPAGVEISTDGIALAQIMGNYQTVEINLTDNGFEPAIVVMQSRQRALWNINITSFDPGNSQLIFPAYYTVLNMEQGNNTIQIMPNDDFDFSTGDNIFYGYVKVVDDIDNVDIEAVKTEVANFETLIYPQAHFESAMSACCR